MNEPRRSTAPTVSVLIPVHNGERFLAEAIESVLGQAGVDFELVVWDDASTDRSVAVAEGYDGVSVFRNPSNLGVYVTRQKALAKLCGRYFLNLDADNRLRPGVLSRMVEILAEAPETVAFVYGQRAYIGDASGVSCFPAFDPDLLKVRNYCDMCSLLRMSVLREVGFDPAFNEAKGDYDLFLSLVSRGWQGLLWDEVVQDYRVHGRSITAGLKANRRQVEVARRLVAKHAGFFGPAAGKAFIARARLRLIGDLRERRHEALDWGERWGDFRMMLRFSRSPYDWATQLWRTFLPPAKRDR